MRGVDSDVAHIEKDTFMVALSEDTYIQLQNFSIEKNITIEDAVKELLTRVRWVQGELFEDPPSE